KDSRNIVVQIELCSFHRDVYYTSRCQIARPFVAPFEAKGVYCTKRLSASVSKNLRRGVHPAGYIQRVEEPFAAGEVGRSKSGSGGRTLRLMPSLLRLGPHFQARFVSLQRRDSKLHLKL